ncbi:hypothetical protein [Consotaella aegiceratis]|uniref:hypothetical protein n=1 Tax=Consotaella aegiceratis TaxID=3097961 RepID=UPI002F408C87
MNSLFRDRNNGRGTAEKPYWQAGAPENGTPNRPNSRGREQIGREGAGAPRSRRETGGHPLSVSIGQVLAIGIGASISALSGKTRAI